MVKHSVASSFFVQLFRYLICLSIHKYLYLSGTSYSKLPRSNLDDYCQLMFQQKHQSGKTPHKVNHSYREFFLTSAVCLLSLWQAKALLRLRIESNSVFVNQVPFPGHPLSSCFSKSDILEKDFEQRPQQYFFTSECVCKCARRFDLSAKARWQSGHLYGFSPVWVRICPWSNHGLLNALPQILHLHGKVCVRMCILSAPSDT